MEKALFLNIFDLFKKFILIFQSMNFLKMCNIFKNIKNAINYIKLLIKYCCCSNEKKIHNIDIFQKIYQNCSDKPYGILSFETLVQIRMFNESTRDPTEKAYLRLLEGFIKILDYLCHMNSRALLKKYISNLNEMMQDETRSKFKSLLNFIASSLKLSLQTINQYLTIRMLKRKVVLLEKRVTKFGLLNEEHTFIYNYCKILNKLPRLALIRRGLIWKTLSNK